MNIITHAKIDQRLCGKPLAVKDGFSRVKLVATEDMAADESGLIHGGFIFGLADYAAMIAVNHPNVVLGAASVTFFKPVSIGDTLVAEAVITRQTGKKHPVRVAVTRGDETVFKGEFTCFIPDQHVLHGSGASNPGNG